MLSFHVTRDANPDQVSFNGHEWRGPGILIASKRHPAVEFRHTFDLGKLTITGRERVVESGFDLQPDYLSLQLERNCRGVNVRLAAGERGVCPLSITCTASELKGHWDPSELYTSLASHELSPLYASHFLAGLEQPYGHRTVFPRLWRLTSRTKCHWISGNPEPKFQVPEPETRLRPLKLKKNVDVIRAFEASLLAAVGQFEPSSQIEGCLLSGGLDSAIAAAVGKKASGRTLYSYGLVVPGVESKGQRARRRELVKHFGFEDVEIDTAEFLPLSPESFRATENRVVPWEECYYEAFSELLRHAAARGNTTMLTGTGGDELCMLYSYEQESSSCVASPAYTPLPCFLTEYVAQHYKCPIPRAPRGRIPSSSLSAAGSSSALFLRHGIWTRSPFCTPELVRLCWRLPREWRAERKLWRKYLACVGCSRRITHPISTEDFLPVMELGLRKHAEYIENLFMDSRLAAMGYIEPDLYRREFRDWCCGVRVSYDPAHFLFAATLELSVRSVEARRAQCGGAAV